MSGHFEIEDFNLNNINEKFLGKTESTCDFYINFIKQIYKYTPFIIFPTFNQLKKEIVLKTLSAPVINFLITYTRFLSHVNYLSPCEHIEHDIMFHGTLTHLNLYKIIDISLDNIDYLFSSENFIKNYKNYGPELKTIYSNAISNYFLNLKVNEDNIDLYFYFFHESGFGGITISLQKLKNDIIKKQKQKQKTFKNLNEKKQEIFNEIKQIFTSAESYATKATESIELYKKIYEGYHNKSIK